MTALLWRFRAAVAVLAAIGLLAAAAVLPGTAQPDGLSMYEVRRCSVWSVESLK